MILFRSFSSAIVPIILSFSFISACQSSPQGGADSSAQFESASQKNTNADATNADVIEQGASCETADSKTPQRCLAVQYVAYTQDGGLSTVDAAQARTNLKVANTIWSQCGVSFTLERFLTPEPSTLGLKQNPSESSELPEIRKAFESDEQLLVVTTGNWNRSGSLGSTGANAWATVPGTFPTGIVLEDSVGTFGNIVAHELGHLLGLDHSSVKTNLMSPLIYDNSNQLTSSDCETANQTIDLYWRPMLR
jgi:hypothetical protein